MESIAAPGGDDGLERPVVSFAAPGKSLAALTVSVNVADEFTSYT
jgi:hypothetical protein